MAGYSGTPLPKKLGIKEGHRVLLVGAPDAFALAGVEATREERPKAGPRYDVAVFFAHAYAEVDAGLPILRERMEPAAGLWIAWPKKASGVATDLTEDRVRERALAGRLVDNKVCAIDETWSGLRLVIRVKDR